MTSIAIAFDQSNINIASFDSILLKNLRKSLKVNVSLQSQA
jgi:hypothetical protein